MKKILLASVGAFAVSMVSAQAAEPVKLSIGGEMTQWFGYADNDVKGFNDVDQQSDALINFSGETALDNGLTVGVRVVTQATQRKNAYSNGPNRNVKYAYGYISGKYGLLSLGQQQNIGIKIHNSAPDVSTIGAQDGNWMNWIVAPSGKTTSASGNSFGFNDINMATYVVDDRAADKINYFTPTWNGLQAGFTYVPDTNLGNTGALSMAQKYGADNSAGDLYVAGLSYKQDFNGVGLGADVSYIAGNLASGVAEYKLNAVQSGISVSYKDFTLGGSYLNRSSGTGREAKALVQAGDFWDVGLSYDADPWAVSFVYYQGNARTFDTTQKDQTRLFNLGGRYNLGPGINLTGSIFHADYDSKYKENENKGWGVVSGLSIAF